VVVVDDGSEPAIPPADFAPWTILRHAENRGKGAALKTGLRYGWKQGFDFAVTLDADGQHPPELVRSILSGLRPGTLTLGRRRRKLGEMPWPRIISNTLTSLILSLRTGKRIHDSQVGFRAYPLRPEWYWQSPENGFQYESAVLLRAARIGLLFDWVDIPTRYSSKGISHIRHVSDTLNFIRLIASSFLWPNI